MDELPTLKPLHELIPSDFPDRLRDIAEQLFLQLLDEDLYQRRSNRERLIADIALRQTDRLSWELGGANMYVHKGVSFRLTARNQRMRSEFRGDYTVLARRYKLSEMQVRNIVDGQQLDEFRRKQCDMFPDSQAAAPLARARRGRRKI